MLKNLYIENVAVAKSLNIDFNNGLSVITGETGAGKSIIIECLSALCGTKLTKDMIRSGEDKATICAIFSELKNHLTDLNFFGISPDDNDELVVQRVYTIDGKNTVKINGRTMPLSILKDISFVLLSINSQHDSQSLLDKIELLKMLDSYANNDNLLSEYSIIYEKLIKKEQEIDELKNSIKDKTMMIDILKYQLAEIENAKLSSLDEEEKLEKLKTKLKSIEQVSKHSNFVHKILSDGDKADACSLLMRAAQSIRNLSGVMDDAEELANTLENYRYEIEDISEKVYDLIANDDMQNSDQKLDQVEKRLSLINKLKKKYGNSIEEILAFRDSAKQRLSDLESGDMRVAELEKEYDLIYSDAKNIADKLNNNRIVAGNNLAKNVIDTLIFLDMPKVKFIIDIKPTIVDGKLKLGSRGYDDIDFLISANPGEPPQSISKVASGGELSRVMLAVKSVMSKASGADTVIFDEIDTGVSGATSEKIGLKLQDISTYSQVICVTHSPQISALADYHYKIKKSIINNRSESSVEELDVDGRISELSRIIGGVDITEKQIEAAKEMILKKYKR